MSIAPVADSLDYSYHSKKSSGQILAQFYSLIYRRPRRIARTMVPFWKTRGFLSRKMSIKNRWFESVEIEISNSNKITIWLHDIYLDNRIIKYFWIVLQLTNHFENNPILNFKNYWPMVRTRKMQSTEWGKMNREGAMYECACCGRIYVCFQ